MLPWPERRVAKSLLRFAIVGIAENPAMNAGEAVYSQRNAALYTLYQYLQVLMWK
jgi:hypothetical protein